MNTLKDIYNKYKVGDWPDKDSIHSYVSVYEEILAPYRHSAKNVLEIGLMNGESLRMWTEYFDGKVYGMDCSIKPINGLADLTHVILEGYNVVIGDASNYSDVVKNFNGIKFDVVIEDANHDIKQQISIYETFKPYLNNGAIYIIEDIQDIDNHREIFETFDFEKEITLIDNRHIKGRYDDCLVIIKDKP